MATLASELILGSRIHAVTPHVALDRVIEWARERTSRYVCFADVNLVMHAHNDASFREIINRAALVAPDGTPVVTALRVLGADANRTCGPDALPLVLSAAEREGLPVGFYGASSATLQKLVARAKAEHPRLHVAYAVSPPFRALTEDEDAAMAAEVKESGTRILFVGLGCPKQERWMAAHSPEIPAVMLGVGAAFDFYAGTVRRAPVWTRQAGLEWTVRLMREPGRLWRRYLLHNPRFLLLFARQLLLKW
jgi:N-acetylglucosaminyldiphosphoundecaprenol N-acetyl-beta-D-mannosaminyltransferase